MISISKPIIGKGEQRAVLQVLKSGRLVQGESVEQFENAFAKYCKVKYAIATSSGTTALHLALLACGIGPSDEVITTSFTFIASANSVLYTGAKPVFIDIDKETFNVNTGLIESAVTSKTKAILPVHLFGLPADMGKIMKIARKHNLKVIEDACQAHGASVQDTSRRDQNQWRKVGSIGDVGCFSFYATKNMTTGEGGVITTNDGEIAKKCGLLRQHGMEKRYYHEELGFNFRMTEIQAVMGLVQLSKLDEFNQKRISNANYLTQQLKDIVVCPKVPKDMLHVFHQYTIRVKASLRDKLKEKLQKMGIGSETYYPVPVYKQSFYKNNYKDLYLSETEKACREVLSIPVHPALTQSDLKKIVVEVNRFIAKT